MRVCVAPPEGIASFANVMTHFRDRILPARRAGLLVLAGLLFTGCRPAGSTDSAEAPPERPDLGSWPAELDQRLDAAEHAIARGDDIGWITLARLYQANGFMGRAAAGYARVEALVAADAELARLRADVARQEGDPEAERRWLEHTVALAPTYTAARLQLAELLYKTGERDAALAHYAAVLSGDPNNGYAIVALARDEDTRGGTEAAVARLSALTTGEAGWSSAHALLAQIYARRGETSRAAGHRQQARARKDPPVKDPWLARLEDDCFDLARLSVAFEERAKSGDGEGAARAFDRMETVAPDHWRVRRYRAVIHRRQNRPREAALEYEAALASGADPETIYPALVGVWREAGDSIRAARQAAAGLKVLPRQAGLWVAQAELQRAAGAPVEAEASLAAALAVAPNHVEANRQLAQLLWTRGRQADAMAPLEVVRRLAPDDFAARAMIGQLHVQAERWSEAVELLREAVALQPADERLARLFASACLKRGNQLAQNRESAAALAIYDEAIGAVPTYLEAYANKTRLLLQAGNRIEARAAFAALVERDPTNPRVQLMWGDIQNLLGEMGGASRSWRTARDLLPADADPGLRTTIDQRLP